MIRRLYERFVLPRGIHRVCGQRPVERQRAKVVPQARGRVLEVGIGTGHNLRFYDPAQVESVTGVDPAVHHTGHASAAAAAVAFPVRLLEASAEELPLPDASFDTVVVTYTLCSIPDAPRALGEMRRVLRADGRLLFVEHGRAPDPAVRAWQARLDRPWQAISGGCHLARDIPALLQAAGFALEDLETLYLPGARWLNYNYWGTARPA